LKSTLILTLSLIAAFFISAFGDAPDEFVRGLWIGYYDTPHEPPNDWFECVPNVDDTAWTADNIRAHVKSCVNCFFKQRTFRSDCS